jgi:hypothetical protein
MILAGAKSLEDGLATFAKLMDRFLKHYDGIRSKENFQAVLDEMPEPTRWEMTKYVRR